jgi:hypothetical protein
VKAVVFEAEPPSKMKVSVSSAPSPLKVAIVPGERGAESGCDTRFEQLEPAGSVDETERRRMEWARERYEVNGRCS